VTGFSLPPPTIPSLYEISDIGAEICPITGDIRDYEALNKAFVSRKPEIVFHLAAQPIVREGYKNPRYTYETNLMGTVNILECVRISGCVRSFVNVTTDKVYENREWEWGYRECERLNGSDPYSNSKSCSELATGCYKKAFFADAGIAVSTVRAGNVIGGGDFAPDRVIPDCVRAAVEHRDIVIRNPGSVRPYQHVLEPLYAYLMIASSQYGDLKYSGSYNVGPNEGGCLATGELADLFCSEWGEELKWTSGQSEGPKETRYLKLDCSKIKSTFGWRPKWDIKTAVEKTVEWYKLWQNSGEVNRYMDKQINEFFGTEAY
jgi:CDP-glucose 4,6-dehydratase